MVSIELMNTIVKMNEWFAFYLKKDFIVMIRETIQRGR
jgi:hypothetical protein